MEKILQMQWFLASSNLNSRESLQFTNTKIDVSIPNITEKLKQFSDFQKFFLAYFHLASMRKRLYASDIYHYSFEFQLREWTPWLSNLLNIRNIPSSVSSYSDFFIHTKIHFKQVERKGTFRERFQHGRETSSRISHFPSVESTNWIFAFACIVWN